LEQTTLEFIQEEDKEILLRLEVQGGWELKQVMEIMVL